MTPLKTYKLKLEAILDEQFPKFGLNNRGAALVLFAHAVILVNKLLRDERKAWLNDERCRMCGTGLKPDPTSNMCAKCWEEE